MKIAVDMIIICTKRNVDSIVPPFWNFKEACRTSLVPWEIQLFAQTVANGHVRRRQLLKAAEGGVYRRAMMALSSKYVFHRKRYPCV